MRHKGKDRVFGSWEVGRACSRITKRRVTYRRGVTAFGDEAGFQSLDLLG